MTDEVLDIARRIGRTPADNSGEHLDRVHGTYQLWFGAGYDLEALDVVLATAAGERLDGDPPWLLVVGGSGAAKTETLMPLAGAGAVVVSTLSGEAALLSGTSKKDRAEHANGGLLRQIGGHGTLVIKDMTSILSMNRDTRASILGALREIYDGSWSRDVGTDGGQRLSWQGRLIVIGAVTSAWDAAYEVIATMGDRFLLVRVSDTQRRRAGRQAMRNVASETEMRDDLAQTVTKLLDSVDPHAAIDLDDDEVDLLVVAADLVTQARTAVQRDRQGGPAFAHALEMPTRFGKQLTQQFAAVSRSACPAATR